MDPSVSSLGTPDLGVRSHAGRSEREHTVTEALFLPTVAACEVSVTQQLPTSLISVTEAVKDSSMPETSTLHENNRTAQGPHRRTPSVGSEVSDYGSLPGLASGSSNSSVGGRDFDADTVHPRVGDTRNIGATSSLPSNSVLTPMPQPQPTVPPPWHQRGQARAAPHLAASPSYNRHRHSWRSDSSSSTGSLPALVDGSSSDDGEDGWDSSDGSLPGLMEDTDSDSDGPPPLLRSLSGSSSDGEGGAGGSQPGRRVHSRVDVGRQSRGAQAGVNRRDVLNNMVNCHVQ